MTESNIFKVLIPLDGSLHAERALGYVTELARLGRLDARLLAVVDEGQTLFPPLPDDLREGESDILDAYLREKADAIREKAASVETVVAIGSPARVILDEAERSSADLVVISSHARSGLERWHLGSVADKVIRGATCNTLVVGPDAPETPAIRSILVPLDGSKHAEEALPMARKLADALEARLWLLTVVPPTVLTARYEYLREQLLGEGVTQANAYFSGLRAQTGDAEAIVVAGPPVQRITEFVRENSIDLVVMTSHGQGGFMRAVLGSVTDRLLSGTAPVLIVRTREGALGNAQ